MSTFALSRWERQTREGGRRLSPVLSLAPVDGNKPSVQA